MITYIFNFFSKVGLDLVSRFLGIITLPIIARGLGPNGYGKLTYANVIASYFVIFLDFGFTTHGINEIVSKKRTDILVGEIISAQILIVFFSIVINCIISFFLFDFNFSLLVFLFIIGLYLQTFNISYYYIAVKKLYLLSIAQLIGQIIYVALIIFVFGIFKNVISIIIISIFTYLLTASVLFFSFLKENRIVLRISFVKLFKLIRKVYPLGIANKLEGITTSFIVLILGLYLSEYFVGVYSAAFKIFAILLSIVQSLTYTLMPSILNNAKKQLLEKPANNNLNILFYLFVFSGISLGLFTFYFSPHLIHLLFGGKFDKSVYLLKFFAITITLWPIHMFIGNILIALNNYKYYLLLTSITFISSVVYSIILIELLGITGAALVLPISALVSIIIGFFLLKRQLNNVSFNFKLLDLISPTNFIDSLYSIISQSIIK